MLVIGLLGYWLGGNAQSVEEILAKKEGESLAEQVAFLLNEHESLVRDQSELSWEVASKAGELALQAGDSARWWASQFALAKSGLALKRLDTTRVVLDQVYPRLAEAQVSEAEWWARLGSWYLKSDQLDSAQTHFERARNLGKAEPNPRMEAFALRYLGVLADYGGEQEQAIRYLLEGLSIFERLEDQQGMGMCQISLGKVNERVKKYESAVEAYQQALAHFSEANLPFWQAIALNNLGSVHLQMDAWEEAQTYVERALTLNQQTEDRNTRAAILTNLAYMAWRKQDFSAALRYDQEVLRNYQESGSRIGEIQAFNNVAYVFREMGNQDSAAWYAEHSLRLAESLSAKPQKRSALINLSTIEANRGNFETAYGHSRAYILLNDTLTEERNRKQLDELQVQYETAKKEQAIVLANSRIQRRNWLLAFLGLLILVLVVIVIQRRRLAQKEQLLARQEMEQVQQAAQLKALSAMIEGQESERNRIARDLHDGLGGLLSSMRFRLQNQPPEAAKSSADQMIQETADEVRRIAHHMVPGVLVRFGLIPALESLCENITQSGKLDLQFQQLGNWSADALSQEQQSMLYRIIQELVQNILKHAQATEGLVQISHFDAQLEITVEDNGIGFDLDAARTGLGLQSIEARVSYLNGSFLMESKAGEGTSVLITLEG